MIVIIFLAKIVKNENNTRKRMKSLCSNDRIKEHIGYFLSFGTTESMRANGPVVGGPSFLTAKKELQPTTHRKYPISRLSSLGIY